MHDTHETTYRCQEFFRIIHEGTRAGLYFVEVLPTGEEKETLLAAPLKVSVITGEGGGLLLEWHDPDNNPHTYVIPAEKMQGERFPVPILPMVDGGWSTYVLLKGEKRRMFRRFLVAAWNTERQESDEQVPERQI